jgi:hypothetical protein
MVDGTAHNTLYRINLATGAASAIGVHGIANMEALAFHPPTGKLYGASFRSPLTLYTLNTQTGAATDPRALGRAFQGMAWDSTRNVMVGLDTQPSPSTPSTLFSIDVSFGTLTMLQATTRVVNYGMTYSPDIDRFWVVELSGRFAQLDPSHQFARTELGFLPSGYTCIASVPAP